MNEISIVVNGAKYCGWLSATVNAGIDKLARAFSLSITKDFPSYPSIPIRAGATCEIYIDEHKIIKGYVDATPISYSANSVTVNINGRSKTCDLIDCCTPQAGTMCPTATSWNNTISKNALTRPLFSSTQWENSRIDKILCDLCAPFDINVIVNKKLAEIKTSFSTTIGQTVASSIKKLMLVENLIIMDNEQGELVIAAVGENGTCSDSLVLGQNILAASCSHDYSKLYSDYSVYAQKATKDNESAEQGTGNYGLAFNNVVTRPRYTDIKLTGQNVTQTCQERANFEVNFNNALTKVINVQVQGWTQKNGEVWKPNSFVNYKDEVLGFDAQFLIKEVNYSISNGGTITSLTLIDPLAYRSDAVTAQKNNKKSSTENKDSWANVKPIEGK